MKAFVSVIAAVLFVLAVGNLVFGLSRAFEPGGISVIGIIANLVFAMLLAAPALLLWRRGRALRYGK